MAKFDIGALNVKLAADTREFIQGMARAQTSINQTSQAAVGMQNRFTNMNRAMSAQNVSRMATALRMPALGRGAAAGAAFGEVAAAAGVGGLIGRGGHPAVMAAIAGAVALHQRIDSLNKSREASIARIAEFEDQIRQDMEEQSRMIQERVASTRRITEQVLDPVGARTREQREGVLAQINELGTEIERRRQEFSRMTAGGSFVSPADAQYREATEELRRAQERLQGQYNNIGDAGRAGALIGLGRLGLDRARDIANPFIEAMESQRNSFMGRAAGAEMMAPVSAARQEREKAEMELVRALNENTDEWRRSNQRYPDIMPAMAGRISQQIEMLLMQRRR